ncbi:MAG: IS110 family transposase [Thermoleophilia bacterium]
MHRRCSMSKQSHYKVGCDAHKHYSLFAVLDHRGRPVDQTRVNHEPGAIRAFVSRFPPGTPVALETVGNWYWIVDEIEQAGCVPLLAHAQMAKKMMGHVHKTDKLDAQGLAILQHLGSLPTVWIAPRETRDERELPRTRMALSKMRTALKNRMHSTLAKYALSLDTQSDIYAPKWRPQLMQLICSLPDETRRCMEQELELLDQVQEQIHRLEARILERVQMTPTIQLIQSVPGPAKILSIVIDREVGSIDRFPSPHHFASYSGLVPKVMASGGKTHYGKMIKAANNYLKWAFIEAANVVVRQQHHPRWRQKYVVALFERTRQRKGHAVAVGAVARYLAEATYWVLMKGEPYREPVPQHPAGRKSAVSFKQGQVRT